MPDLLDGNGLQVKTLEEIRNDLIDRFKAVYGADINVDQDTPDGQLIGIMAQASADLRELLTNVFASLDPEQAEGRVLDQRVAINGLRRKSGTFTKINVDITIDKPVNLIGLDAAINDTNGNGYTIQDGEGNKFILAESQYLTSAGMYTLLFRARDIGAVTVLPNTLNLPVTVIAGVVLINNTESPVLIGQDEESDFQLRRRREKLFSLSGSGFLDNIISSLANIDKVTSANVLENVSDFTDDNGIPAHGLWTIVEGGADMDIALALYQKRPAGIPMKGAVEIEVPTRASLTKTMRFDRPIYIEIYLKFNLGMKNDGIFDPVFVKNKIIENIVFEVGKGAFASEISAFILSLNTDYVVTETGVSLDNYSWQEFLYPGSPQRKFLLDIERITIE